MSRLMSVLLVAALVPLPLRNPDPQPDSLPATGVITGHVRDQQGAPIANAQVSVVATSHTTLTDASGRYLLAAVPAGTFSLRAAFIGYRAVRHEGVTVKSGDSTVVDFALAQSTVVIEDIVVYSAPPAAPRDEVATRRRIDGQFTNAMPMEEASVSTGKAAA